MPAGFSCGPCAPFQWQVCRSDAAALRRSGRGGFQGPPQFPPLGIWGGHTYLPDPACGFAAAVFHPRDCYVVRAAACGCVCAEDHVVNKMRHRRRRVFIDTHGARQRRLHRGGGSGRGRRLDAAARTRLDRLPAAARSRAACLGRDRHRLGAPRGVNAIKKFEIKGWAKGAWSAQASGQPDLHRKSRAATHRD